MNMNAQSIGYLLDDLRHRFREFLDWWLGELSALIPHRLRRDKTQQQNRLVLQVEDHRLVLIHCRGQDRQELALLGLAPEARAENRRMLDELHLPAAVLEDTTLRLPRHRVLQHVLQFPQAVQENTRQVLEYEMDRQTPFRADEVYYDFRVLDRPAKNGQIGIELTLAPQSYINPLLAELQDLGLRPKVVDLAPEDAGDNGSCVRSGIDLRPPGQGVPEKGPGKRITLALAGLTAILLVAALSIPLLQMRSALGDLEERLAAARQEALQTSALAATLNERVDELQFLLRRKAESPPIIEVLAELTRILPDETWLQGFDMEGSSIRIGGESDVSSNLIGLIEASPRFTDAGFRSPVTLSRVSGKERFQISAQIVGRSLP